MFTTRQTQHKASYTPSGLAATTTLFNYVPTLSTAQKRTASRAILRNGKCLNIIADAPKNGGLDNMYIDLHGLGNAEGDEALEVDKLMDDTVKDLLNVVRHVFNSLETSSLLTHA